MDKERIYLTDITLHAQERRQTTNFAKVAQKGRMYSPLPPETAKTVDPEAKTARISFQFPPDLQERINKDEVEIMVPKDGLMVYAGRDVINLAKSMQKQAHREDVHDKWGKKSWQDSKSGV